MAARAASRPQGACRHRQFFIKMYNQITKSKWENLMFGTDVEMPTMRPSSYPCLAEIKTHVRAILLNE